MTASTVCGTHTTFMSR